MEGERQRPGPPPGQTDILSIKTHSDTMMVRKTYPQMHTREHQGSVVALPVRGSTKGTPLRTVCFSVSPRPVPVSLAVFTSVSDSVSASTTLLLCLPPWITCIMSAPVEQPAWLETKSPTSSQGSKCGRRPSAPVSPGRTSCRALSPKCLLSH